MKIYALNNQVIFECEACGTKQVVPAARSKRVFMRPLNAFEWQHSGCAHRIELQRKRDEAFSIADSLIKQLQSSSVSNG